MSEHTLEEIRQIKARLRELEELARQEEEQQFRAAVQFFRDSAQQLRSIVNVIETNRVKFSTYLSPEEKALLQGFTLAFAMGQNPQCNLL